MIDVNVKKAIEILGDLEGVTTDEFYECYKTACKLHDNKIYPKSYAVREACILGYGLKTYQKNISQGYFVHDGFDAQIEAAAKECNLEEYEVYTDGFYNTYLEFCEKDGVKPRDKRAVVREACARYGLKVKREQKVVQLIKTFTRTSNTMI